MRVGKIVNEKNMLKDCRLDWGPVLSCLVNLWNLTCYLAFHNKTMKLGLQCQWWTKLHAEMCTVYHNCMKQEINEMVKLTKWSMSFLLEEQEKLIFHLMTPTVLDTHDSPRGIVNPAREQFRSMLCIIQILQFVSWVLYRTKSPTSKESMSQGWPLQCN